MNGHEPDVLADIEAFTCLMFGYAREKSVNSVRRIMLRKMVGEDAKLTTKSKIDLSRPPPCSDNLKPHIYHVNYRLATYKRADQPIFVRPKPYDDSQGWIKGDNGNLEPVLPPSLINLIEHIIDLVENTAESNEEGQEQEFDYDEMFDDE